MAMPAQHATPAPASKRYLFAALDPALWEQARQGIDPGVLVCDGIETYLRVRHEQLEITDGTPDDRRVRKLPRTPRTVSRVIVLGNNGFTTYETLRWLVNSGIGYTHIDRDGQILTTTGPSRDDARLIRSQSCASPGGINERAGLEITRSLLSAKLAGQAANLRDIFHMATVAQMIDDYARCLAACETVDECRAWEAQSAAVYWKAWSGNVNVPFPPGELHKLPPHWLSYSARTSFAFKYEKNKDATDPVNACLNWLYRVGETEAVHACHALGLHPALGLLHADKSGRDSMALDLLESIRPLCDRLVLSLMDTGLGVPVNEDGKPCYLDRRLFRETGEGVCRLVPPLTHKLAAYCGQLAREIAPHAAHAARTLAMAAHGDIATRKLRTPRKTPTVPVLSCKPARLRPGVGQCDLIPDALWQQIRPLIPPPPPRPDGRKGRPRDTGQDRAAIAALAAHELLNVPWTAMPIPVDKQLCQARFREWSWRKSGDNGVSVWDTIAELIQSARHLSALVNAS